MIESAIYDPAHEGNLDAVREWLEKNPARLNDAISDGYSLLHIACIFGHESIVAFLLGRHALVNLNAKNQSKATPLHNAVMFRVEDCAARIAKQLIANGAELNAVQAGGQTPLHHAVGRSSSQLTELLVLAGADPLLKDDQGRSSIDVAKEIGDPEVSAALQRQLGKSTQLVDRETRTTS